MDNPYQKNDDWNRDEAWEDGYDAALETVIKLVRKAGESQGWAGGYGDGIAKALSVIEQVRASLDDD